MYSSHDVFYKNISIKNIQELINQNELENNTEHAEKNQAILDDLEIQYLEILEDLEGLS